MLLIRKKTNEYFIYSTYIEAKETTEISLSI
jgi:hypothetical protein